MQNSRGKDSNLPPAPQDKHLLPPDHAQFCVLIGNYWLLVLELAGAAAPPCVMGSSASAQSDGQQTKNIHKHSEVGNNSTINSEGTVYQYDQKITVEIEIMITV